MLETYLSITTNVAAGLIGVTVIIALTSIIILGIVLGMVLSCRRLKCALIKAMPEQRRWFIKPQRKTQREVPESVRIVSRKVRAKA